MWAKIFFENQNYLMSALCFVIFIIIYLILIGGLINRYLNNGRVLKAFNIVEIMVLLKRFDLKLFLQLLIAAVIAQLFAILSIIDLHQGLTLAELLASVPVFVRAPFLYFATKRLVGLQVRKLVG